MNSYYRTINEIGDDCIDMYFEHDYNPESDRTTIYQVTVNNEMGQVKSIRFHGWHQGKPYEGDEHEPSTLVRTMKF